MLARALAVHFKKTGNLTDRAKVNVSKSDIVKLRTQELVNKTIAIRDLGTVAVSQTDAAKRGVTAARVAALTAAITAFSNVMNSPRGEIVNRSALLREIETDIAALLDKTNDLDDLALQFDGTEAGQRFNEAWKGAPASLWTAAAATALWPSRPRRLLRRRRNTRYGWEPVDLGSRASSPRPSPPFRMEERVPAGRERMFCGAFYQSSAGVGIRTAGVRRLSLSAACPAGRSRTTPAR